MSRCPPILYEDEWLIAFDKPANMLVAPDRWDKTRENLMALVHAQLSPQYFNAHRLDRETSGVLLCAKDKQTLGRLFRMFREGQVIKEYVALVRGRPPDSRGQFTWRLAPDPRRPGLMRVSATGKSAVTRYEVLELFPRYAYVRLRPLTGRTHQLRVHLARAGCPAVCDSFYGDGAPLLLSELKRGYKFKKGEEERPLINRLGLHAIRLSLAHPTTGQRLVIESPLPHDFELSLKYLRKYGGST